MAAIYKVLAQVIPSANTATTLYTCSTANGAVASTLVLCNQSVSTTVRVAVRPAGATLATSQYIMFDSAISGNDSLFLTLGISVANTDVITCYANTANVSFSLFGSELT
jgi:hypothetical protein